MGVSTKVKIEDFVLAEANYELGKYKYQVKDLIEASKNLPVFDIPLCGIDIGVTPWGERIDIKSFAYHMKRVNEANMDYPILLDLNGYICDGWHRVTKAILEGRDTIKARKLEVMPDCLIND